MSQSDALSSTAEYILKLLSEGRKKADIEDELLDKGYDAAFVNEILEETIKLRNNKIRALGMVLILVGALCCFTSFLLTITSSLSQSGMSMGLFGLTSVGIVVIFAGLVKIF